MTLRAEMNVIVVLANCPHVLDPRPDYTRRRRCARRAWRGAGHAARTIRSATPRPKALRAFLNVEDYYRR